MASSGNLLADRRYAYAEAAFAEDDVVAAADLARQVLELAPDFAPGWFLLGKSLEADGPDRDGAVAAFRRVLVLDPPDRLGAGVRLALLGVGEPETAMSAGYVRELFDDYAGRFDRHLRQGLGYRAPELLRDAVRRACSRRLRPFRFDAALDLGCGTGLAAEAFHDVAGRIAGVDLSPAMLRKAEGKRLYGELATGDLLAWLEGRAAGSADLVLAADVFVYVADLTPVFAAAARALRPGGMFAFTVQAGGGDAVRLGEDGRFAHGESYLRHVAAGTGLAVLLIEGVSTRRDRGADVPGLVAVLEPEAQARSV